MTLPLSTLRALWDFLDDPMALEREEIRMNDPIARDFRAELSSEEARKVTREGGPTYRELADTLAKVWSGVCDGDRQRLFGTGNWTSSNDETVRFVEARKP